MQNASRNDTEQSREKVIKTKIPSFLQYSVHRIGRLSPSVCRVLVGVYCYDTFSFHRGINHL